MPGADLTAGGGDPEPVPGALDGLGRGVLVQLGAGCLGPHDESLVQASGLKAARAVQHQAGVVRGRPDLVGQFVTGHEVGGDAGVGELVGLVAEVLDHAGVMGQVQLARALVVAGDRFFGDQPLDLVEGVVHRTVQAWAQRAVLPLEPGRPHLQLRDDHAPVAGAGAPAQCLTVDHRDVLAPPGELGGGGEAAVPAAHDDGVHRRGERCRRSGRRRRISDPERCLLVVVGQRCGHGETVIAVILEGLRPRQALTSSLRDMTDITPFRIGAERLGADRDEVSVVRSPYDGHEVGRVPAGTDADLDAAVAAALGLPPRGRAAERTSGPRSSTAPPRCWPSPSAGASPARSPRRRPSPSRPPGSRPRARSTRSGSRPPRPARSPARWCRSTPAARPASGKLGFVLRVPIGVVGAISPFNFPLNLVAHKVAPAIAAGCPVVLKPASATPLTALRLADLLLDECGLPAGLAQRRHVPGLGGQPPRRPPRRRHDHLHRLARRRLGHPGPGAPQEGRPRARQQRPGHHRARRPTWTPRPPRSASAGFSLRRPVVHLGAAGLRAPRRSPTTFLDRLVPTGRGAASSATRSTTTPTCRALIDPGETERVDARGSTTPSTAAPSVRRAAATSGRRGAGAPPCSTDVTPDMEVCRTEVFGPVVGVQTYDDFDEALAPGQRHPLRAAGRRLHRRPRPRRCGPARDARLRRRPGQRGADVAGRPDALRRRPRLGQHPGGPGLRRRRR